MYIVYVCIIEPSDVSTLNQVEGNYTYTCEINPNYCPYDNYVRFRRDEERCIILRGNK